ncbi:PAS domain-containing protein (plasmid) [Streptomyces sp. NBC_01527]|uniref:PAS domain-containing protein n=1 Tax=unclassified Streptomyces TaxID=2593676 RepID=UPI002E0E5CD9|nr:PAS domain-containing protein [Streptomyces sp. NBC_01230]
MVNASGIDYKAVFQALPSAVALFTTDLVYADVNEAFLSSMGRTRDQAVGRYLWAAFPDDLKDIDAGLARLADSLTRHQGAEPETLADALLADLTPPAGVTDDTALVVLRL